MGSLALLQLHPQAFVFSCLILKSLLELFKFRCLRLLLRLLSGIDTVFQFDRIKRLGVVRNSGQMIKRAITVGCKLCEEPIISVAGVLQAVLCGKLVSLKLFVKLFGHSLGIALLSCDHRLDTDHVPLKTLEFDLQLTKYLTTLVRGGFEFRDVFVLDEGLWIVAANL